MSTSSFRGGNIEEMRQLAKTYVKNAQAVGEVIRALDGHTVESSRIWTGPAADQFRSEWHAAKATFQKMQQALDNAHKAVDKNAANIELATN
jgi:WXG100 family type VII secretion target